MEVAEGSVVGIWEPHRTFNVPFQYSFLKGGRAWVSESFTHGLKICLCLSFLDELKEFAWYL